MNGWIGAIIGFIGVILGIVIVEVRLWRERKERYQVVTFEKRLEVHQQAFSWCVKMATHLGQSYGEISSDEANLHSITLNELYEEATDWYGNNCLYLDEASRKSIFDAIGLLLDRAEQLMNNTRETSQFVQQARKTVGKTMRYIANGLGVKYLPDIDRQFRKSKIPKK